VLRLGGAVTLALVMAFSAVAQSSTSPTVTAPSAPPVVPPPTAPTATSDPVDRPAPPATPPTTPSVEPKSPHVALVLPLETTALASVAAAIRDGWMVAADVDGRRAAPFKLYAVADEQAALVEGAKKAIAAGAVLVVGGITRDGTRTLAQHGRWGVTLLALNHPPENERWAEGLHYITLAIDLEGRQAASQAFLEGLRSVVIVATPTPLSRRIAEAFEREWVRVGGSIAKSTVFNGSPQGAATLKTQTLETTPDFIFYAVDAREARAARPYLPSVRMAFGTSLLSDFRADPLTNLDLAGTRFVEMPWFVQPDHPAVATYARPARPIGYELEKLFALGIDAYRATVNLLKPIARREATLDGVTGRLDFTGAAITRTPLTVEYVDGRMALRP
jgi:uncharacterized protein